jgi:hypothetical protein
MSGPCAELETGEEHLSAFLSVVLSGLNIAISHQAYLEMMGIEIATYRNVANEAKGSTTATPARTTCTPSCSPHHVHVEHRNALGEQERGTSLGSSAASSSLGKRWYLLRNGRKRGE